MSSSSTATLSVPSATPHLRAVRAVQPPAAERWHPGAAQQNGPQHAVPQLPPQGLLTALPEGATVVATVPQSALPQGLLAQYGVQFGAAGSHPMVGYLVLVPAEAAQAAPGLGLPAGAPAAAPAPVPDPAQRPAKPAGQGITVDIERRNAYVDGKLLDLTYLEFELLAHLTDHPQRVHTRDHLVSAVWGYGHVGDGRTVDVHVARLRRKLGPAYRDSIVTVRRVGYKYTPAA
ncbi:transcriptional regulator [Kitasatospora indigofera]|uniref:Transcriptional regulator n=1 Tax=Kitasatospora indigofera TaxID=67307 RepID=A0A919FF08_9ACTN|nr:winged helix-turn-helix domain-containing protein [Kitasatospora indigofera]GHH63062.1 transcriptional regulator [Kitasatospora indigofera]